MKTPSQLRSLTLEYTCVGISQRKWDKLMDGAVRADKQKINRLVKTHLPDLYENLCLDYYNPYNYYKTSTHLILVHSSIEYFLKMDFGVA